MQLESFCHWWPRCRKDTGHGACEDAPARIFPSVATNKPGKHNPSPRLSSGGAKTPLCWHLLPWCHTERHLTPWGHAAAPQTRGQHQRGHWRPGMTPGSQNREEGKGWKLSVSSGVIITRVITRVHAAGMEFWASRGVWGTEGSRAQRIPRIRGFGGVEGSKETKGSLLPTDGSQGWHQLLWPQWHLLRG